VNNIWLAPLGALAVLVALSAALWKAAGPFWGWCALLAGFVLLAIRHLGNVARLQQWARAPFGTPPPEGTGRWDLIFAELNRRVRAAQEQRQQLSSALNRFLEAAQAMPDGVIILRRDGAIEWLNAAAESQFGLHAGTDVGYPLTNLLRQPEFVRFLDADTFAEPLVMRPTRAPGQTVALQVIPFGDDQKLLIARNITHLERLETMRRDFVANVSHELKTPLTVVRGFIETLADSYGELSAEETAQYLRLAGEQAARMQQLIDDLLALSALETEGTPPQEEEVDVAGLIADAASDAEALSAGRHAIEVEPGPPATLIGSGKELRSAFGNLASNAVRYTPPGGHVRLSWRMAPNGAGIFSVRDNGIGIEAQHIPRLTERFYRVERSRSRDAGGTGLGLAIVKHVLTRHQASMDVSSEPGRGSTFSVTFPARRVLPAARPGS
jgi:two-component system phosphate regulon sensor histidine kinase PhoR